MTREYEDLSDHLQDIGNRIHVRRRARRLSRAELALRLRERFGLRISKQSLYNIETGRQSPSLKTLLAIALELDADWRSWFREGLPVHEVLGNPGLAEKVAGVLANGISPRRILESLLKALDLDSLQGD